MVVLPNTTIRGATVKFRSDFPEIVMPTIREIFEQVEWLVPRWVHEIEFAWRGAPENGETLQVNIDVPYAWVVVYVTGNWMDLDGELQRQAVCHEFCHLWLQPVAGFLRSTLDTLLRDENPKTREIIDAEATNRVEQSVQALSWAITAHLDGMKSDGTKTMKLEGEV